MRASLDKSLLAAMLCRGGWSTIVEADHEKSKPSTPNGSPVCNESEEWLLSRRLSWQCALASGWTGNGLEVRQAIVESSQIDFTELTHGHSAASGEQSRGLVFSTSVCGRYLLVARDTLIYIYSFWRGCLEPVTTVVCPRRVLSVSLDASKGRHAVAAILEGRMGMICDLRYSRKLEHTSSHEGRQVAVSCNEDGEWFQHPGGSSGGLNMTFDCAQEQTARTLAEINVRSQGQSVGLQGIDNHRTHDINLVNHSWNLDLRGSPKGPISAAEIYSHGIPIDSGTSTFYRHLCSEDDPPRCVAICPQRRCVAFGCSAGIELHWIDALTGQSLSR
jgi:hypothetical protein